MLLLKLEISRGRRGRVGLAKRHDTDTRIFSVLGIVLIVSFSTSTKYS